MSGVLGRVFTMGRTLSPVFAFGGTEVFVVADSVSPSFHRVTTVQVRFPRFILAEVNTHRVFSRSYRSSRAVPTATLIQEVRENPFIPGQLLRNQPGMQGGEALSFEEQSFALHVWKNAALAAATYAEVLANSGAHKQHANRVLEPYLYVDGLITATDWDNFFKLRCHKDAQPEFQVLATLIQEALMNSTPEPRPAIDLDDERGWHLPYVTDEERETYPVEDLRELSAARCAWISYRPFDPGSDSDQLKARRTFQKLVGDPMHASPMEHVCTPIGAGIPDRGNLTGWGQFRHLLEEQRNGR